MCKCVRDWQDDPAVPPEVSHRRKPVTCAEYVSALEAVVRRLSADSTLPEKLLATCATSWREESPIPRPDRTWNCAEKGHLPMMDGACMNCGEPAWG